MISSSESKMATSVYLYSVLKHKLTSNKVDQLETNKQMIS
jgi:hypothetical protein